MARAIDIGDGNRPSRYPLSAGSGGLKKDNGMLWDSQRSGALCRRTQFRIFFAPYK